MTENNTNRDLTSAENKKDLSNKIKLSVFADSSLCYVAYATENNIKIFRKNQTQNEFSFLHEITIKNNSDVILNNLKLKLTFSPSWIKCDDVVIPSLFNRSVPVSISSFNINISSQDIMSLKESIPASLNCALYDENGEVVAEKNHNFRILPGGESSFPKWMPEILTCFITPHDSEVLKVRNIAQQLYLKNYKKTFAGYIRSTGKDITEMVSCVYSALQSLNLTYVPYDTIYENNYQRVRLPYSVLTENQGGTCVDLSLLFASVLESLEINAVLIDMVGHVFLGIFLDKYTHLHHRMENNATEIKALDYSGKLMLLNAVDITRNTRPITFNEAVKDGENCLRDMKLEYVSDVYLCRNEGLLPVNTERNKNGENKITFTTPSEPKIEELLLKRETSVLPEAETSLNNKFEYWQESLLDLSLNNTLINFNIRKNTIQISDPEEELFLKTLLKKDSFTLMPFEYKAEENNVPESRVINFNRPYYQNYFKADLASGYIKATSLSLTPAIQDLKSLVKENKRAEEERGANILYLTIGLLTFKVAEENSSLRNKQVSAPVLLVPVKLQSANSGTTYKLIPDKDAVTVNSSLFEYFRQKKEYGLDFTNIENYIANLKDIKNLSLEKIFNTIWNGLREGGKEGWDLNPHATFLSAFSFEHMVMWNDIKDKKDLMMKSPLIESLVNRHFYKGNKNNIGLTDYDKTAPSSYVLPFKADSSQLYAIEEASEGESIILQGPPGTGKSQTIANIIADYMAKGKTVLFVAEKGNALSVVKKRLDEVGLGHFALKVLLDDKAKSNVLASLEDSLNYKADKDYKDEFINLSSRLAKERDELNISVKMIHDPFAFFLSSYDAFIRYLPLKDYKDKLTCEEKTARSFTEKSFNDALDSLEAVQKSFHDFNGYKNSPLRFYQSRKYSSDLREAEIKETENLLGILENENEKTDSAFLTEFKGAELTYGNLLSIKKMLSLLLEEPQPYLNNIEKERVYMHRNEILNYLEEEEDLKKKEEDLLRLCSPSVLNLDPETFKAEKEQVEVKKGLFLILSKKSFVKKMNKLYGKKGGIKLTYEDADKILTLFKAYDSALKTVKESKNYSDIFTDSDLQKYTSDDYKKLITRFTKAIPLMEEARKLSLLNGYTPNTILINLKKELEKDEEDRLYEEEKALNEIITQVTEMKEKFDFTLEKFSAVSSFAKELSAELYKVIAHKDDLVSWAHFLINIDNAYKNNAGFAVSSLLKENIKENELIPSFKESVYETILKVSAKENGTEEFDDNLFDKKIEDYNKDLTEFRKLSALYTASKVSMRKEKLTKGTDSPLYGLTKLIYNGGKGYTLRQIFSLYFSSILTLTPCIFMSPMALAQYIEMKEGHDFDLVIFDEASQIRTAEAVSALARAKTVIVSGDKEQMPPSTFFESQLTLEGDDIRYEDLPSLLDDFELLHLKEVQLNWHYRSHHESLIAFSNCSFYNNGLYTFPSSAEQTSHVKFLNVHGEYSANNTNAKEADEIIKEIIRRISDKNLSRLSIGVITFNVNQMNLISNKLDKEKLKYPKLSFLPGGEEIFVKNLENVQGDERDVILFSTGYAVDKESGKLPLTFGPLSREHGERRLNVAVSRAREDMLVYSSFEPEDIDVRRTRNDGAKYLRSFLSYARDGNAALHINVKDTKERKAGFEEDLAQRLISQGLITDCNVGTSSFRVDIGIHDPFDSSKYILAVLLDGESYCSTPLCLDRNSVQPSVLKSLGWNIMRITSAEYYDRPSRVVRKIIRRVQELSGKKTEENTSDLASMLKSEGIGVIEKKKYPSQEEYITFSIRLKSSRLSDYMDYVQRLIKKEAPLSLTYLTEKVNKEVKNFSRAAALKKEFPMVLSSLSFYRDYFAGQYFYYLSKAQQDNYHIHRSLNNERGFSDIPKEEISSAVLDLLNEEKKEVPLEEMEKKLSALFNAEVNEDNKGYLEAAVNYGAQQKLYTIQEKEGNTVLTK